MMLAKSERYLTVTTSWDDGHPSDLRLANLLARHGALGTFYIPTRNSEGRQVLTAGQIADLATHHEVGGHTRDHVPLIGLSSDRAYDQIWSNKLYLEETIRRRVSGFAFVRGASSRLTRNLVRRAGFSYARCIRSLASARPNRPFAVPVTVQFFPHRSATYLKNFISGGPTVSRVRLLTTALSHGSLASRCLALADACARSGHHFHLWGHSWELDEFGLWQELDDFFVQLKELTPRYVTNSESIRAGCRDDGSSAISSGASIGVARNDAASTAATSIAT